LKVSVEWLQSYVRPGVGVHQLAEKLTSTLNEVEEVRELSGLAKIAVGEVLGIAPHPNAERLWLTKVQVGRRQYSIVCGASNLALGQKVPVAVPGVTLPSGLEIERRTIRGVESYGMLCSARELGVGEDHSGIWVLPADAVSGQTLPQALGSRFDTFELEVLANRPDCLGHLGVAREVAAAFKVPLREPPLKTPSKPKRGPWRAVSSEPERCSRFSLAVLSGLTNRPSPLWMQRRLTAVGMRPINAIVDVTNYVLLEYGQPLHAYDAAKLSGRRLEARLARRGESVRTLDGRQRRLDPQTLVIADASGPLGLAGIMGGQSSEVGNATTGIVLECAHFAGAPIRRTARRLGVRTEASARFEKGIAEATTAPAIRRAVDLLLEICGGQLDQLGGLGNPPRPSKIRLEYTRMERFLGIGIPAVEVKRLLKRLGFGVEATTTRTQVSVPWWRSDVRQPVDLYEEVARSYGYDAIPATLPVAPLAVSNRPPLYRLTEQLKTLLVAAGFSEVMTHSLLGDQLLEQLGYPTDGLVEMANPLSADHTKLRGSLEPRHLEAVAANLRWRDSLRLFELGTVFAPVEPATSLPTEYFQLLLTAAGKRPGAAVAELRSALQLVFQRLRIDPSRIGYERLGKGGYPVSQGWAVSIDEKQLGHIAEYAHPKRLKAGEVWFACLNIAPLAECVPAQWSVTAPPPFPGVTRDLSVRMPARGTYANLAVLIRQSGGVLLHSLRPLEEYLSQNERSLTVRLEFAHPERTLTDQEVHQAVHKLSSALKRGGFALRE